MRPRKNAKLRASKVLLSWILLLAFGAMAGHAQEGVELFQLKRQGHDVLRLSLPAELGDSWQAVNVGQITLKTPGAQRRVDPETATQALSSRHFELRPPAESCYVLLLELGPPAAKGRVDAWQRITRASKIVECPAAAPANQLLLRQRMTETATAKVGSKVEIRPLANPLLIRPGSDLPVRIYWQGIAQKDALVEATGPSGELLHSRTDAVGITSFHLTASGRWALRYLHPQAPDPAAMAELVFTVMPSEFWSAAGDER